MTFARKLLVAAAIAAFSITGFSAAGAQAAPPTSTAPSPSPIGIWRVFDEKGGEAGLVQISMWADQLVGRVIKMNPRPGVTKASLCDRCEGTQKDQPLIGLAILWGFKQDGDGWSGGRIVDPSSGDVYSSELHVADDGRTLLVRGYMGIPLFGRTTTWLRAS